jgi:hypothetical protein
MVGATLVLIALDGHPVGLLTVPAGATVPVVLWLGWKLLSGWGFRARSIKRPTTAAGLVIDLRLVPASGRLMRRAVETPTVAAALDIGFSPTAVPGRPIWRRVERPTDAAVLDVRFLPEAAPDQPMRIGSERPTTAAGLNIDLRPVLVL